MRSRRTILIVLVIVGFVIVGLLGVLFLQQQNSTVVEDFTPVDEPAIVTTPGLDGSGEVIVDDVVVTLDPAVADDAALIEVVVSLQTVPRGWLMTEAELTTELRFSTEVGPNVLTSIDQAVGRYARNDIFQGETLTGDTLVIDPTLIGEQTFGPASLIPFNWVAQSVPMDRLNSVGYALRPGDAIDVMITFIFVEIDEELETLLPNNATFLFAEEAEEGGVNLTQITIDPYGRFEQLATGEIAHVAPSEAPRPIPVTFVVQNAKVIQVGPWTPPEPPRLPTPTPDPDAEVTPVAAAVTPTPIPPDALVVALPPQQQLLLKYALERNADVDFVLRRAGDGQLFGVEQISTEYFLERFNIDIPPRFPFTVIGKQLFVIFEDQLQEIGGTSGGIDSDGGAVGSDLDSSGGGNTAEPPASGE